MNLQKCFISLLTFVSFASVPCFAQNEDQEHVTLTSNSKQFDESYSASIQQLLDRKFDDGLIAPALGAVNSSEFKNLVSTINKEIPIPGVSPGDSSVEYDVVLQPGHYARKTGAVGTSGVHVSERALVAYITGKVADVLSKRSLKVLVISADKYIVDDRITPVNEGLKAKMFLTIHADGNVKPCNTGPSLAYETKSSMMAMHAIGWALAQALGYSYEDFRKDNLTVNASNYYMFKHVSTKSMKGLLEIGELTCRKTEEALIAGADAISENLARAIVFITE